MALKIVRNDITKMNTEAIVNTANEHVAVGPGCDMAIYEAAGYDELLAYRREHIGEVAEGEAFITPGFGLDAKYIIHAVSPRYINGEEDEEPKLRSCYQKSLALAKENGIKSIAFPLIATGSFRYPKEEGIRIAADEINGFLLRNIMDVTLVVYDEESTELSSHLWALERQISRFERQERRKVEREKFLEFLKGRKEKSDHYESMPRSSAPPIEREDEPEVYYSKMPSMSSSFDQFEEEYDIPLFSTEEEEKVCYASAAPPILSEEEYEELDRKLQERIAHKSDTFSEYLMYLIELKGLKNADVYKAALVDKKLFSKIKNNPEYHPQKLTALCLCVGARLNLDETIDLLARAGYALSPSDMTDIIFKFFIENEYYDMLEIDIKLEEHGVDCIVA